MPAATAEWCHFTILLVKRRCCRTEKGLRRCSTFGFFPFLHKCIEIRSPKISFRKFDKRTGVYIFTYFRLKFLVYPGRVFSEFHSAFLIQIFSWVIISTLFHHNNTGFPGENLFIYGFVVLRTDKLIIDGYISKARPISFGFLAL